jgi:hypothetical protein
MLCIPNHAAMQLQTAENEFFKFSNDLTHGNKPGDNPHARKHFPIDNYTVQIPACLPAPFRVVAVLPACPVLLLPLDGQSPAEQPPEIG